MGFDFDDLEEEDPAELSTVVTMSDEEFEGFRARIGKAEIELRYGDFAEAVGEAVFNEELMPVRMPKIILAFTSLLEEVTSRSMPDIGAAGAIVYTLWMLSVSTSLHEVRVRKAESQEVGRVVLVLGFGGSDVVDLEYQADFYEKQGFTVITTSRCALPYSLSQKQDFMIAQELKSALTDGVQFVLHLNSQHGVIYSSSIMQKWMNREDPYHSLPPLEEVLKGFIIDNASPSAIDPESGIMLYPTDLETAEKQIAKARELAKQSDESKDEGEAAVESEDSPLVKSQIKFYRAVLLGCLGALSKKYGLKSLEEMVVKNKEIAKAFNMASRMSLDPPSWMTQFVAKTDGMDPFLRFQMIDWKLPALPRLMLYSYADQLIKADMVESYIRHMKKYRPEAELVIKQVKTSAHCKNWETEAEMSAEAVTNFFKSTVKLTLPNGK